MTEKSADNSKWLSSRLVWSWSNISAGAVSWSNNFDSWKPWKSSDYPGKLMDFIFYKDWFILRHVLYSLQFYYSGCLMVLFYMKEVVHLTSFRKCFATIFLFHNIYLLECGFEYLQVYGFYDECLRKYGSVNVWRYCTDIFDYLRFVTPLCLWL